MSVKELVVVVVVSCGDAVKRSLSGFSAENTDRKLGRSISGLV